MKNLHLMPMDSHICDTNINELNKIMPQDANLFVLSHEREITKRVENCIFCPSMLSVDYINEHYSEYNHIVLHSLYFSRSELLRIDDAAAKKIIWSVWGHDLYSVKAKPKKNIKSKAAEVIHFFKMALRGTFIREKNARRKAAHKVRLFHAVSIGFPYDRRMIRKKYKRRVNVVIAPYFSDYVTHSIWKLREERLQSHRESVNVLVGHSGYSFIEHEKYLRLLSVYKDHNIHINLVLCYGASEEKVAYLTDLAVSLFGREKCTIITKLMPREEYFNFLKTMDIGIFPYKHQSGVGNTESMAFMGAKMYFDVHGVMYKGFQDGGVKAYNCKMIGKVPFDEFSLNDTVSDPSAPLFRMFDYDADVQCWRNLLS